MVGTYRSEHKGLPETRLYIAPTSNGDNSSDIYRKTTFRIIKWLHNDIISKSIWITLETYVVIIYFVTYWLVDECQVKPSLCGLVNITRCNL